MSGLLEYEIQKNQDYIQWSKKRLDVVVEKEAILGEIPVLIYFSPNRLKVVESQLNNIMKSAESSANTISNLLYLYENMVEKKPVDKVKIKQLKDHLKAISASKDKINSTRAMCERGFFCQQQFSRGIRSEALVQKGIILLGRGISSGSAVGMPKEEVAIWKYYLAEMYRQLFEIKVSQMGGEGDGLQLVPYFNDMAKCYHAFTESAQEVACNLYVDRAAINILLTIQTNAKFVEPLLQQVLPSQSDILKVMYQEKFSFAEQILAKSKIDYHIPYVIAKINLSCSQFEEAVKYSDLSMEMENCDELPSLVIKLHAYTELASIPETGIATSNQLDSKYLDLAYNVGKKIQKICMMQSPGYLMSQVCYHLAVDTTSEPLYIRKGAEGYLEDAVRFAIIGIQTQKGAQHAGLHRLMGECLWLKTCYQDSILYLRKAVHMESSAGFFDTFSALISKYRFILFNKSLNECFKERMLRFLATDIEAEWEKVVNAESIRLLLRFTADVSVYNENYTKDILTKLEVGNTFKAKEIYESYCYMLQQFEDSPQWLKDYCSTVKVA